MSARVGLVLVAALAAGGVARADTSLGEEPIDPRPWLGISYDAARGEIHVTNVFEGSGALACGLRPGDRIVAVDDVDMSLGVSLGEVIESRQPGDRLTLQVRRGGRTVVLHPVLTARISDGERLHRQLVGKLVPGFVLDRPDEKAADLDDSLLADRVGIMVWYHQSCGGCAGLANRIAPWVERNRRDAAGMVGISFDHNGTPLTARTLLAHTPVMLPVGLDFDPRSDESPTLKFGLFDNRDDRAAVIVTDQRGIVRMAAVLRADADEAALENVFAVAERQLRHRKPRR